MRRDTGIFRPHGAKPNGRQGMRSAAYPVLFCLKKSDGNGEQLWYNHSI